MTLCNHIVFLFFFRCFCYSDETLKKCYLIWKTIIIIIIIYYERAFRWWTTRIFVRSSIAGLCSRTKYDRNRPIYRFGETNSEHKQRARSSLLWNKEKFKTNFACKSHPTSTLPKQWTNRSSSNNNNNKKNL